LKLYRFEALINSSENVSIIVVASDELSAFETAELELEKNYLKLPVIEELSLIDTRTIRKKAGFVINS
jgi:c-di-GMP-binding flagellar brake protein YcgR